MNANKPVSKVLVLDDDAAYAESLKRFCDDHNLNAMKVRRDRLNKVLASNIDLGGILLGDDYGGSVATATDTAVSVHALRPELPIILRRRGTTSTRDLPTDLQQRICAAFDAEHIAALAGIVDEYIFSLDFPNALVRGISEITESRLAGVFAGIEVTRDTPSVVRDRIIFGEVFSLIPLEGSWCRGYMMMQTEEAPLLQILDTMVGEGADADFRDINSQLGELTNLIWGAFKNRFLDDKPEGSLGNQVQVPLLINHRQRYISFGSNNPQLCFQYTLHDPKTGHSAKIDQRFIFSLNWSPENFSEKSEDVAALVDDGVLELF
jgi:CheY-specific phosphatase CheX